MLTVNGQLDPYSTPENPRAPDPPRPSPRLVSLDITLENAANTALGYAPHEFKLKDSQGDEHAAVPTPRFAAAVFGGGQPLAGTTLYAGEHVRGWLAFEVPIDAWPMELIYQPSMDSTPLRAAIPVDTR